MSITTPASGELMAELLRLRDELSQSEARFIDVIERNADAILVVDTEGVIRFANYEAESLFTAAPGALVDNPLGFPLVAGETTELDLVRDGAPLAVEMRVVESHWEGERAWIATLRNITERKREEQHARELIRAEAARETAEGLAGRFRFLAESTAVLSASFDYSQTLSDLARACVDEIADWVIIYSYDGAQLKRTEVMHCDPAKVELARQLKVSAVNHDAEVVANLLETRQPQRAERIDHAALAVMVPDEAQRRIISELGISSFMFVPMIARQKLLGAISFMSADPDEPFQEEDLQLAADLATRAALAIDNARLYDDARQANQAKTELLAIISHDLRTPLNSIIGYGELMKMGIPDPLPARAIEQVARVLVSAKHQLYLIDELLRFARLDGQHEKVELKNSDVREIVKEASSLIEPVAHQKQLTLEVQLPDQPLIAHTDADKLRQVLLNLLGNAVKYTQQGEVRLEAKLSPTGEILIRVHDTGIGISAEDLPLVFEPFWQVSRSQRTQDSGTGLGLAVVKQTVALLGGVVSARSTPGKGSTFEVCLPPRSAS